MSHRTLTIQRLSFYRSRRASEGAHPNELDGDDLLTLIENWCRQLQPRELWNPETRLMVDIDSCTRVRHDALLLVCRVGKWGEAGPVVNIDNIVTANLTDRDSPCVYVHVMVTVPGSERFALYYSEASRRGYAGTRVLEKFNRWFSDNYDFTMAHKFITAAEDWVAGAQLTKLQVVVRQARTDVAATPEEVDAVLTHTLQLPRGRVFKRALLDQVWNHPEVAYRYVQLSDNPERSQVKLTLRNDDGRVKTLVAGDQEGGSIIREEISRDDGDDLTAGEFVALCDSRTADLIDRLA